MNKILFFPQSRRPIFAGLISLVLVVTMVLPDLSASMSAQASSADSHQVFLPIINKAPSGVGSPPVIESFTADPATIITGDSTMLTWDVTGADTLDLAPGIGSVTGSSYQVNPNTTTKYTLTASNAAGTDSAEVWVTVQEPEVDEGGFFVPGIPDIEGPTSNPTVAIDPAGGIHMSFAPDAASGTNPDRSAYYAYCPANCNSASSFTITQLGQNVIYVNLALDPAGYPRLLLTTGANQSVASIEYGTCDSNCTSPSQWTFTLLTYFVPPPSAWGIQFSRNFVLNSEGHPRFVYQDWGDGSPQPHAGNFYAYCDENCHSLANWSEAALEAELNARIFHLALSPTDQPRLVWTSYDQANALTYLAYLECNLNCNDGGNWRTVRMLDTVSSSVEEFASYSLDTDSDGKPHIALYTGTGSGGTLLANVLYYLSCNAADCTQLQNWLVVDLNFPYMHGEEGVSLVIDDQDHPRIAYHAPLTAGFGLYYAWCDSNCETSITDWHTQKIEPSEQLDQELPIPPAEGCAFPQCDPPIPACTLSFWDTGVRSSLAIDSTGNPRIAYDANHNQGGDCTPYSDTRLTRFIPITQP